MSETSIVATSAIGSGESLELLKNTICKGATDGELGLFIQVCKRTGLDPFTRQVFAVKRWDQREKREAMAIQVSIDGFRLIAQRTAKYRGQLGPFWCGPDGEWRDIWLESYPPSAAKVAVLHADFKEPLWSVARFDTYAQKTRDGNLTQMWAKMGDLMIAKCAESLALRKGFPQELSGLYTDDEMAQADTADHFQDVPQMVEPEPEAAPTFTAYDFDLPNAPLEQLRAARQHIKEKEKGHPEYRGICEELKRRAAEMQKPAEAPPALAEMPGVTKGDPRATPEQRERYRIAREVAASHGIDRIYEWPEHISESEAAASLDALDKIIADKERADGYAEMDADLPANFVEGEVVGAVAA